MKQQIEQKREGWGGKGGGGVGMERNKTYLLPANILAILPLLLVTNTSLSSQTIKSSAAMREENEENGSNSSLVAIVSFE